MPFGDGTGPEGRGPRTGRGLGYCSGYNSPGFTREMPLCRGWMRYSRWYGRGFRAGHFVLPRPVYYGPYYTPYNEPAKITKDEEIKILKAELENIDMELREIEREKREIERRIKELEA